jgi:quercetin dioxygenase-like cupin family protein
MFVFNENVMQEAVGDGVKRKILAYSGSLMSVEVSFETGSVGPMHCHPHEQLTYVLSGVFSFTIGDEINIVQAGDTLYKRSGIMHGCTCLEAGKLLDVFTPIREDFLSSQMA